MACRTYATGPEGVILSVYLNVLSPYVTTWRKWESGDCDSPAEVKASGKHDGYVVKDWSPQGDMWIAFDANQIKSVRNSGLWLPQSSSLLDRGQASPDDRRSAISAALSRSGGSDERLKACPIP